MSEDERRRVLDELHSERFADKAPREVWATLLDEGTWLYPNTAILSRTCRGAILKSTYSP